jgi:hypothetical protein
MPIPLNIIPEMCIRRDIKKTGKKVVSDELHICSKVDRDECCLAYVSPAYWCRREGCPLTSLPSKEMTAKQKQVNALKQSKRDARGE